MINTAVTDVEDAKPVKGGDVVLGDDWISPQITTEAELRARRSGRGVLSFNRSPLARKIVMFNLMALIVLVAGVLYLNPFRESLVAQHDRNLVVVAELIADTFEAQLTGEASVEGAVQEPDVLSKTLSNLSLPAGVDVFVFDADHALLSKSIASDRVIPVEATGLETDANRTFITGFLASIWNGISNLLAPERPPILSTDSENRVRSLLPGAFAGHTQIEVGDNTSSEAVFSVAVPISQNGRAMGVVAMVSVTSEIDELVLNQREQVLQMFVIAILVSIGLSLVLASTIANPLSDLAAAAEIGRDRNSRKVSPGRIRIPDLSGRPDEIGRLSGALRGMVAALYDRIDANEQFAADVAHEIKNPLASLRSAVGTMRIIKKEEHRTKLLDVIEHDVRRLDRLVSDISNASRLDSELVKEDEEQFDLVNTMKNIVDYLGKEAEGKGVEFISDLPDTSIEMQGLEARLAQVFVNLITNAISFCEEGDAIRIWGRRRENRVLIVVEDTGPGIPETALTKIFNRFYSERPDGQFGDNSGLGLAISKQIVEAHGGVIWAENIRPTDADLTSDPLGARFVVGLPI